jgi:phage gp29-like protein
MTTGKRSKTAVLTKEVVEQANLCLRNLPEKSEKQANRSLAEAIQPFQPQIQAALSAGSSYDDIADLLAQQGVNLSGAKLKQYMADENRSSTARSKKRNQTTKKTTKRSSSSESKREQKANQRST